MLPLKEVKNRVVVILLFSICSTGFVRSQVPTVDLINPTLDRLIDAYIKSLRVSNDVSVAVTLHFVSLNIDSLKIDLENIIYTDSIPSNDSILFTINTLEIGLSLTDQPPQYFAKYKGHYLLIYVDFEGLFNIHPTPKDVIKKDKDMRRDILTFYTPTWMVIKNCEGKAYIQQSQINIYPFVNKVVIKK